MFIHMMIKYDVIIWRYNMAHRGVPMLVLVCYSALIFPRVLHIMGHIMGFIVAASYGGILWDISP